MRKQIEITINAAKGFYYGNCAIIAISNAFNSTYWDIRDLCCKMRLNWYEGLTFNDCRRVISKMSGGNTKYIPNIANISYYQLLLLFPKEKLIVMFSEHLSYAENGEIFDAFIASNKKKEKLNWLKGKPTGWWIVPKTENKEYVGKYQQPMWA